jgi:hypothetical protein
MCCLRTSLMPPHPPSFLYFFVSLLYIPLRFINDSVVRNCLDLIVKPQPVSRFRVVQQNCDTSISDQKPREKTVVETRCLSIGTLSMC